MAIIFYSYAFIPAIRGDTTLAVANITQPRAPVAPPDAALAGPASILVDGALKRGCISLMKISLQPGVTLFQFVQ